MLFPISFPLDAGVRLLNYPFTLMLLSLIASILLHFSSLNLLLLLFGGCCLCSPVYAERRTGDRGVICLNPGRAASEVWQFRLAHIACVFRRRHQKPLVPSMIEVLSGVYAWGSKISHTGCLEKAYSLNHSPC